jgi:hypothetical protein
MMESSAAPPTTPSSCAPFSSPHYLRMYSPRPRVSQPGDIVALNHGNYGRTEGLVVGSHIDYAVRALPSSHMARH